MKQTAVEWLENQIKTSKYFYKVIEDIQSRSTVAQSNIFEQAKKMEKEQSHAEYMRGWKDGLIKQGPPTPPLDRKIYK
jgi:hypothetical protein